MENFPTRVGEKSLCAFSSLKSEDFSIGCLTDMSLCCWTKERNCDIIMW